MGIFLNSITPYERYKMMVSSEYFVDKTALLEKFIYAVGKEQRFFCIKSQSHNSQCVFKNNL